MTATKADGTDPGLNMLEQLMPDSIADSRRLSVEEQVKGVGRGALEGAATFGLSSKAAENETEQRNAGST
jgi:hypothetical protein